MSAEVKLDQSKTKILKLDEPRESHFQNHNTREISQEKIGTVLVSLLSLCNFMWKIVKNRPINSFAWP